MGSNIVTMCFYPKPMYLGFDPEENPDSPYFTLCSHVYDDGVIYVKVRSDFWTDLTSRIKHLGWILLVLYPFAEYFGFGWIVGLCACFALIARDPNGRHQRAALFHDLCYREQWRVGHDRFTADIVYRTALKHDNVHWVRRDLSYLFLRAFGWIAWEYNKKKYNQEGPGDRYETD